ncbi:hypothetical protein B4N84_11990 [Flavobacterium sp. IR1]|nr:hypothetical protein B4N84_11990 [Flavobacterium sp. IR1]
MNSRVSKFSFFFITTFIFNLSYAIIYFSKFYSKGLYESEADTIINLLFFQVSSTILLLIFSILNPVEIFIHVKKGIDYRKKQNKDYFDIMEYNILRLDNKLTPFLITMLTIFFFSSIIFLVGLVINHFGIPMLEIVQFPFRFAKNLDQSELYYGVYSFLFFNIIYIFVNGHESIKLYSRNFKIYFKSGIHAFLICVFFILFNMMFYFTVDENNSSILEDKAKIAYGMFFNIALVINTYLLEKQQINIKKNESIDQHKKDLKLM